MHFLPFYTIKTNDVTDGSCEITWRSDVTSRKPCNIIQLLTNEALDMMWYRPENTNIGRGEAEVNICILWSISHHIQCLISQ